MLSQNKKAVSAMISYILLITFAIVIAVAVGAWLKTYVPKEGLSCPDGVALYVSDARIDGTELSLTLRNNGRFGVAGFFIYYAEDETQEIATKNLAKKVSSGGSLFGEGIRIGTGGSDNNPFLPGEEKTLTFDVSDVENIYLIQILPMRVPTDGSSKVPISCGDARVNEIVGISEIGSCDPACESYESCNGGVCECAAYCVCASSIYADDSCVDECGNTCQGLIPVENKPSSGSCNSEFECGSLYEENKLNGPGYDDYTWCETWSGDICVWDSGLGICRNPVDCVDFTQDQAACEAAGCIWTE